MKVCRRETFNAAHRLYRPDWSDKKNKEVFGKLVNPNFSYNSGDNKEWETIESLRELVKTHVDPNFTV